MFDLKTYNRYLLTGITLKVRLRDGRKARVLATNILGDCYCIAVAWHCDDRSESISLYAADGHYGSEDMHPNDLMFCLSPKGCLLDVSGKKAELPEGDE